MNIAPIRNLSFSHGLNYGLRMSSPVKTTASVDSFAFRSKNVKQKDAENAENDPNTIVQQYGYDITQDNDYHSIKLDEITTFSINLKEGTSPIGGLAVDKYQAKIDLSTGNPKNAYRDYIYDHTTNSWKSEEEGFTIIGDLQGPYYDIPLNVAKAYGVTACPENIKNVPQGSWVLSGIVSPYDEKSTGDLDITHESPNGRHKVQVLFSCKRDNGHKMTSFTIRSQKEKGEDVILTRNISSKTWKQTVSTPDGKKTFTKKDGEKDWKVST